MLGIIYRLPKKWKKSIPIEGVFKEIVMNGTDKDWEYFGDVFIRACNVKSNIREVDSEYCLVLFRRTGPKSYQRRHELESQMVIDSEIQTLHPVFTRDVANNVWHLKVNGIYDRIITRFTSLVSWPDEDALIIQSGFQRRREVRVLSMEDDLIGVPKKIEGIDPLN